MPPADDLDEITRTLSVPLGELIAAVGRGVAEAQWALDRHAVDSFRSVHNSDDPGSRALRELGWQPTWYRIPEVTAEIYVTLSVSGQKRRGAVGPADTGAKPAPEAPPGETGAPGRIQLSATPVDASFSNTYDYQLRACSQLKFRVVPVPAPGAADGMKGVPRDLVGMTLREAQALLSGQGIAHRLDEPKFYEARGDEPVVATTPAGGEILPAGQVVVLSIGIE